jgi:DNA-directed RNA polymerase specialized sigma24 family protein
MDHGQGQSYAALDDAFIVRLYQQHALSFMTYVRRHVSSREDAEDIVLEVFLAASAQPELSRFSEEKQLAWLQRVAYYKFVDHHRRAMSRPAVSLQEVAETLLADEGQSPDQLLLRNEEEALALEASPGLQMENGSSLRSLLPLRMA